MSLTKQFISLTETKILLTEVSKAKRKALLKKVAKYFHKERGEEELYRRVIRLIEDFPIVVERVYGELDKIGNSPSKRKKFFKKRFDMEDIWEDEYKDRTPQYQHEKWWGLMALIGCVKLFKDLEKVDPTGNMKYGNWLIDVLLNYAIEEDMIGRSGLKRNSPNSNLLTIQNEQGRFYEDLPKLKIYLEAYHEMKQKNELPDEYKDINKLDKLSTADEERGVYTNTWNPFQIMNRITKEYRAIDTGDFFKVVDEKLNKGKDYNVITKDANGYIMYEPLTQKANSLLGMGTEWCTTYGKHCANPDYQDRSPFEYDDLIIVVNKSNPDEKIQIHLDSGQFRDADDKMIKAYKFLLENQEILIWIMEVQPDNFQTWLHEHSSGERFIRNIVVDDKYNKLFEDILVQIEDIEVPNGITGNYARWVLNYEEDRAYLLTTNLEELPKEFGRSRMELEQFLNKVLETRMVDVAEVNKGNFKYDIELSHRFAKAWIVEYNEIVEFSELQIYKR